MTTANREKVYACDYCGSDYTDAKYCCAARREYLNAHGKFETGRAPAASVGDAPSDAVAWELSYPREMPAYELVGAPEFVRSEAHAEKIAAGCESHYGKRATYSALSYTAPPAAPVVSDATKWAQGLIEQLPRDHDGRNSWLLNHGIGEESDWLRAEYARHRAAWKEWREGMPQPEMRKYAAALSVPATDDKGEG